MFDVPQLLMEAPVWTFLIAAIMSSTAHSDMSERINISVIDYFDESMVRMVASVENNNDFAICIPRDQLPVGFIDAGIIILEHDGGVLYYQDGIRPERYPMWVMLPPNSSLEISPVFDLRDFYDAAGGVTGYIHISGLPCSSVTAQTLIYSPLPNYYFPDVSGLSEEYIFFRSDSFSVHLPDPD